MAAQSRCIVLIALTLGGCSWQEPAPERGAVQAPDIVVPAPRTASGSTARAGDIASSAAAVARAQIGVPYRYGGADRGGFDCSGLVYFAYRQSGQRVPRTTGTLWREAIPVSVEELQPGDIIFFRYDRKPSHVGIFLGEGWFVHAPSTGKTVSMASIDNPYYKSRLIRGGRLATD